MVRLVGQLIIRCDKGKAGEEKKRKYCEKLEFRLQSRVWQKNKVIELREDRCKEFEKNK